MGQKTEKMTLNMAEGHPTLFATHTPDIKNMHGKLHISVDQIVSEIPIFSMQKKHPQIL